MIRSASRCSPRKGMGSSQEEHTRAAVCWSRLWQVSQRHHLPLQTTPFEFKGGQSQLENSYASNTSVSCRASWKSGDSWPLTRPATAPRLNIHPGGCLGGIGCQFSMADLEVASSTGRSVESRVSGDAHWGGSSSVVSYVERCTEPRSVLLCAVHRPIETETGGLSTWNLEHLSVPRNRPVSGYTEDSEY